MVSRYLNYSFKTLHMLTLIAVQVNLKWHRGAERSNISESQCCFVLADYITSAGKCLQHSSCTNNSKGSQKTKKNSSYIPPPLSFSLSLVQLSIGAWPLSFQYKRAKNLSIHLSRQRCIIVAVRNVQKIRKTRLDDCRRAPEGQERLNLQV